MRNARNPELFIYHYEVGINYQEVWIIDKSLSFAIGKVKLTIGSHPISIRKIISTISPALLSEVIRSLSKVGTDYQVHT